MKLVLKKIERQIYGYIHIMLKLSVHNNTPNYPRHILLKFSLHFLSLPYTLLLPLFLSLCVSLLYTL
jgi:hypothetical protein